MQHKETKYFCDMCGKKLNTWNNSLDIVTSKSEESLGWSRLHVKIEYTHGCHNDGTTDQADLCKACAVKLLSDALGRVKKGERASEGTQDSRMLKWGESF